METQIILAENIRRIAPRPHRAACSCPCTIIYKHTQRSGLRKAGSDLNETRASRSRHVPETRPEPLADNHLIDSPAREPFCHKVSEK